MSPQLEASSTFTVCALRGVRCVRIHIQSIEITGSMTLTNATGWCTVELEMRATVHQECDNLFDAFLLPKVHLVGGFITGWSSAGVQVQV